jgi:hypothetical protein
MFRMVLKYNICRTDTRGFSYSFGYLESYVGRRFVEIKWEAL